MTIQKNKKSKKVVKDHDQVVIINFSDSQLDLELQTTLTRLAIDIATKQIELDTEAKKILYSNLRKLYRK